MDFEDLLKAWRVNNSLNLEILDFVDDAALDLKPGKGKTVRSNFTHIVSVRGKWVSPGRQVEASAIPKLDWKTATRDELREGLEASSLLIEAELTKKHEKPPKGAWTLPLLFGYMVAHEAHHRSQIEIACRLGGHEFPDSFGYGLWDWSKKVQA